MWFSDSEVFFKKAVLKHLAILTSAFRKISGLQTCSFIKKRLQHRCFLLNIVKYLRTRIFKKICSCLLCIKSGIQERGTECGERGEYGECCLTSNIPGNVSNIPGNAIKHSGKRHEAFRGISPNIPGNVAKHFGEYPKKFRGIWTNNPGNAVKHSGEYPQPFWVMSVLLKGMRTQGQSRISWNL